MKLYNTLARAIQEFKPMDTVATIYTCGPTVYDYAHIGNLRSFTFEDVMKRTLNFAGIQTRHVMNITDVDDKTIKKSDGRKEAHEELTRLYEEKFFEDLAKLNILPPDNVTRATAYIKNMVALVEDLLAKGFAYKSDDGSIYFSIDKFAGYGKLSGLDREGAKAGARVKQDEYDKENPADFALWKAWGESDGEIYWEPSTWLGAETSLGKGRPGWHIECSAMAGEELGKTIDIHAGGVDLVFPHHENEIAQSEAASGQQFARFWVHGEHLLVNNQKMSKSLNNFYTMRDIEEKGFDPLDFRYLCLQAHYRSKLNFTWEAMEAARNARLRLLRIAGEVRSQSKESQNKSEISNPEYLERFKQRIEDDLNTPEALAVMWDMLRDEKISAQDKLSVWNEMDKVLGLASQEEEEQIPEEIQKLAAEREEARKNKDFEASDSLRDQIAEKGYLVEDTSRGVKISKR